MTDFELVAGAIVFGGAICGTIAIIVWLINTPSGLEDFRDED